MEFYGQYVFLFQIFIWNMQNKQIIVMDPENIYIYIYSLWGQKACLVDPLVVRACYIYVLVYCIFHVFCYSEIYLLNCTYIISAWNLYYLTQHISSMKRPSLLDKSIKPAWCHGGHIYEY